MTTKEEREKGHKRRKCALIPELLSCLIERTFSVQSIIQHHHEPVKPHDSTNGDAAADRSTIYNALEADVVLPLEPDVLVHNK